MKTELAKFLFSKINSQLFILFLFLNLLVILSSCGRKNLMTSFPFPLAHEKLEITPKEQVQKNELGKEIISLETTSPEILNKESQNGDWLVKEKASKSDGISYKEETLLNEHIIESAKKDYQDTQMSQVPIDPKYNTQLLRIEGIDTNNAIFVAPKIYSFSANEVNRMLPLVNEEEGTITLFFPIMFIDGLSESVTSPDSQHTSIKIPKNLLIQDIPELNNFISKKYLSFGEQNLARLPGCPKEIIMTVAGKKFNIDSDILKSSDYCDYNVPIYTSIKLPKKEALWLLQVGLYSGAAQITAIFETKVPYTISKFSIEMNKAKLYEKISANFKAKIFYSEENLKIEINKIVNSMAVKINIQGNITDKYESIVKFVIDEFFLRIQSDVTKVNKSCGKAPVCLILNDTEVSKKDSFLVEWVQKSNVLSGQHITTWARLFPLSDANIRFENLKNSDIKKSTELVLMNGDLIELKIFNVILEKYSQNKSVSVKHSNVQVGTVRGPDICVDAPDTCGENDAGGHGHARSCNKRCSPTFNPQFEDQWIEETIFTVTANNEEIITPIGKLNTITDEIFFGFSWFENGVLITKECPANSFQREGDGRSLLIRISNVPGCEIFTKNSTNKPKLYLINKASFSLEQLSEGKISRNWRGEITNNTKNFSSQTSSTYSGEVSIRGYKIGNTDDSTFGSDIK